MARGVQKKNNGLVISLSIVLFLVVVVAVILYSSSQSQVVSLNSQLQESQSQVIGLQSQLQSAKLNIDSSASVFDSNLHDLLQANAFLLTETARRAPTNAAYNAVLSQLQTNNNQVAAILNPIYGSNSSELVNLWNVKANIFINYSQSLRNNDTNAMFYYNSALVAYVPQIVAFWQTTSNPYPVIDSATITSLVYQHLADIKAAIDDWNSGNYVAYYNDLDAAYLQMGTFADVMAQAIINQNPQSFQ
ncbi:MAG: hypothetical protein WAU65_02340 [Candidatus Nanoarchaeia archaeon]